MKIKTPADKGAVSVQVADCGELIFSHRKRLAKIAEKWCQENGADLSPINVVTALNAMGCIYKPSARKTIEHHDRRA